MPTFSLIIATAGRSKELHRLFASFEQGDPADCECILVDQNPDQRLAPIIAFWQDRLPIRHLSSTPGLSRARNLGLRQATGRILAFPDDDCWYSPGLLQEVKTFFNSSSEYDLLSTGVRDQSGVLSGNRWLRSSCDLATVNLFRTSVGLALFVRRSPRTDAIHFDELLGVGAGTPFASGEDTDYVFRLLAAGAKGRFQQDLTVHHPRRDMLSGSISPLRAYSYGCGMGRVLRKQVKPQLLPPFVAFDFLRMTASILQGRPHAASMCAAHGRGVFAGFMAHP